MQNIESSFLKDDQRKLRIYWRLWWSHFKCTCCSL